MELIYKEKFVARMAEEYGMTKVAARQEYDRVFKMLQSLVIAGETVIIPEFGRFKTVDRKERVVTKPKRTPDEETVRVTVPAHKAVKFMPEPCVKGGVNQ